MDMEKLKLLVDPRDTFAVRELINAKDILVPIDIFSKFITGEIPTTTFRVYMAIHERTPIIFDGIRWIAISQKKLVKITKLSSPTILSALKELRKHKLLILWKQGGNNTINPNEFLVLGYFKHTDQNIIHAYENKLPPFDAISQ